MTAPAEPADASSASDLILFRTAVREALAGLSPPAAVRQQMATDQGWDTQTWTRLCRELGMAGLAVPAEYGGSGFSLVELGIAVEEAGRALLCAPLFATAALAVPLLLALGDEQASRRYLPSLADGSQTATVAIADGAGRIVPDGELVRAAERHGEQVLRGTACFVVDGATAGLILVPAAGPDGIGVYAVPAGAAGLTATPLITLDPTRKLARLDFDDVTGTRIGARDCTGEVGQALDVARALLAAEQAGGAARCLELTVEYARSRIQFGRAIGSFQAVKQKAADMLIRVESMRSAALAATQAAARATGARPASAGLSDLPELAVAAAVAGSYCAEAFLAVAADTIQLHGGVGFTWEHDAHLFFKRAWTSRELLGGPAEQIEALAGRLADL